MGEMAKAFVETSILVDATLATGPENEKAKAAVNSYAESEIPVYAFKEFRNGPLSNFRFVHNVLVETKSFSQTLARVRNLFRRPYMLSTSLQALHSNSISLTIQQFAHKYPGTTNVDSALADEARLAIRAAIFDAWDARKTISTRVTNTLSCFQEGNIKLERGQIVLDEIGCKLKQGECCLAPLLRNKKRVIEELIRILKQSPKKRERDKSLSVLTNLNRSGAAKMGDMDCRNLGDAFFVLFAPNNCEILTKNTVDFNILASATGGRISSHYP